MAKIHIWCFISQFQQFYPITMIILLCNRYLDYARRNEVGWLPPWTISSTKKNWRLSPFIMVKKRFRRRNPSTAISGLLYHHFWSKCMYIMVESPFFYNRNCCHGARHALPWPRLQVATARAKQIGPATAAVMIWGVPAMYPIAGWFLLGKSHL